MANGLFGGGTGASANPYIIEDKADFKAIAAYLSAFFVLKNDIDFVSDTMALITSQFTGKIDGAGYTVKNAGFTGGGLFNELKGVIDSLRFDNISIAGSASIISVETPPNGSTSSGTVALVQYVTGSLINTNVSNLTINNATMLLAGLCAKIESTGKVSNCDISSTLTGKGVAGICLDVNGELSKCKSTLVASVAGTTGAGGISQYTSSSGIISDCHATSNISGTASYAGGISAGGVGTIQRCYAEGVIQGTNYVGGIQGSQYGGNITDCFAMETTLKISSANASNCKGIVGYKAGGTITNNRRRDTLAIVLT